METGDRFLYVSGINDNADIKTTRPRVIMLTGVDDVSVAIKAVKLGANDYITKPYRMETLLECIHRVLAR